MDSFLEKQATTESDVAFLKGQTEQLQDILGLAYILKMYKTKK